MQLNSNQRNHICTVLRKKDEDEIRIFNQCCGEWNAIITNAKKGIVQCKHQTHVGLEHSAEPSLNIAIGIVSHPKMQMICEKLTELGVSNIYPIITQYTQYKNSNIEKFQQIAVFASEQSRRMDIPVIHNSQTLEVFLNAFNPTDTLLVADETMESAVNIYSQIDRKSAFLIGPEGGFSMEEREKFDNYRFIKKICINRNILRSETAAIACASIWKSKTSSD